MLGAHSFPRVPLRSIRGHAPAPLRGGGDETECRQVGIGVGDEVQSPSVELGIRPGDVVSHRGDSFALRGAAIAPLILGV